MSYVRFGLMILTSTLVMFVLMYLNTYAWEHVRFSETRVYMAIMMGAAMALIMLGYMLGMYRKAWLNAAIFAGAVIVFVLALWLVRSQAVISGPSYMRAMIPHHSIAIMTSERAQIEDPRVRKLADEIIEAQRREIAEMNHLIAAVSEGGPARTAPPEQAARQGTVQDALGNTVVSRLDLAPLSREEAGQVLQGQPDCGFAYSRHSDPVFWTAPQGRAAIKLNGVLVALQGASDADSGRFSADGAEIRLQTLDAGGEAELLFTLEDGLEVGYRGSFDCRRG